MDINIDSFESFLKIQSSLNFQLVPAKGSEWQGFFRQRREDIGFIGNANVVYDVMGHLDLDFYRLWIPISLKKSGYIYNGIGLGNCTLFTPNTDINIRLPEGINDVHIGFEKTFFERLALRNKAYDLLLENKFFSYKDHAILEVINLVLKALEDKAIPLEITLKKVIDLFFSIHALEDPKEETLLSKAHIMKHVLPFFQENVYKDLSMLETAEFLGMSRRTFERDFKLHYGITPAQYFKNLKTVKVYKEIMKGGDVLLSEIYRKFEIFHAGHFGQHYKQIFKEPPSATLRKINNTI